MSFLSDVRAKYSVSEEETPYALTCKALANDDEVFNHIAHYVSGDPNALSEYPALTKKLESVLKKIPPFKPRETKWVFPAPEYFYRGESKSRKFENPRSVESWTPNKDVAWDFAKNNASPVVLRTSGPIQGVSIADICYWRMQIRPKENHFSSDLGEWLLLRPKRVDTIYSEDTGWLV